MLIRQPKVKHRLRPKRSTISEIHGRHITEEKVKIPIIIPMSTFEPPWSDMKRGKRKKDPKLQTLKKLARAKVTNEGVISMGFKGMFTFGYPQPGLLTTRQGSAKTIRNGSGLQGSISIDGVQPVIFFSARS